MKLTAILTGLALATALVAVAQRRAAPSSPPLAKNEAEKRILGVLDEIVKSGKTYLSVPQQDGRMLRLLTEAAGAKNVVEIGTSTGYSGLWFCLALRATGGKLTTFEMDHARASTAREHFQRAGVDQIVTIVEGNAHENITRLKEPIDVVFIDADKEGYLDYYQKLLPLVRPGGLILAHNIDMPAVASGYVKTVTANPDLETVFYMEGGALAVTLKKR
ncbi:MAG: class I SAM-dependent methyltransferase [Acidobacteria bacterium]|nr:class I SAM-dependent methyltransferase [Acidobacteriota bacterium]